MGKKGKKLKVLFISRDRKLFSALARNAFTEQQKFLACSSYQNSIRDIFSAKPIW